MKHVAEAEGGSTDTSTDQEYTDRDELSRFARTFFRTFRKTALTDGDSFSVQSQRSPILATRCDRESNGRLERAGSVPPRASARGSPYRRSSPLYGTTCLRLVRWALTISTGATERNTTTMPHRWPSHSA
jgi:hypothetical protein